MLASFCQRYEKYASVLLRVGLAIVFLYFSIVEKLLFPELTYATLELAQFIPPIDIRLAVLLGGILELVIALCLLLGFLTRYAALIGAILLIILQFMFGFFVLIRDVGLIGGLLALTLRGSPVLSVDAWREKRKKAKTETKASSS